MAKISRKHHYLPIFYLNGFTNSEGKLFVYNKITDTILENVDPSSIFFEKDLNNFQHEGKTVLSLEDDFYMDHDSRASVFLRNFLENKPMANVEESVNYQFQLTWFMINLFWRIPNHQKKFEEIIERNGIHHKYFQIVDSINNTAAPQEIIDEIKSDVINNSQNRKAFKLVYPFSTLLSGEVKRIIDRSKDYSIWGEYFLVTGDNPFISNNKNFDIDNILGEFIFPFSRSRLLTAVDSAPNYINSYLLMTINACILDQSERFICSHSLENLKQLLKFYQLYKEQNLQNTIFEECFNLISEMSGFSNNDDYVRYKQDESKNKTRHKKP
jgi:hypothetical protein